MKKVYDLYSDGWREDFRYAYGPQARSEEQFVLRTEDGALTNDYSTEAHDYSYICALSKKKYTGKIKLTLTCSFKRSGAPLIVFTNDLTKRESGAIGLNMHFEVVAYRGGCNGWRVIPFPERTGWPVLSTKILKEEFPIPEDEWVTVCAEIDGCDVDVEIMGRKLHFHDDNIPKEFYVGFTACEGICRFAQFTVEEL